MTVTALISLLQAQTGGDRVVIGYPVDTNMMKDIDRVASTYTGITTIFIKHGAESQ